MGHTACFEMKAKINLHSLHFKHTEFKLQLIRPEFDPAGIRFVLVHVVCAPALAFVAGCVTKGRYWLTVTQASINVSCTNAPRRSQSLRITLYDHTEPARHTPASAVLSFFLCSEHSGKGQSIRSHTHAHTHRLVFIIIRLTLTVICQRDSQ